MTSGTVISIVVTDEDIVRLKAIDIDRDAGDALKFLRERIIPEVRRQESLKMKWPVDGGRQGAR